MPRPLVFGAAVLLLASGAAGASLAAPTPPAIEVALGQLAPAACAKAELVEGRSAFADDNGEQAHVAEDRPTGQTFRKDLTISMRNIVLLAITSLVLGLGAIGAKALWILDDTQSSSHGWPRWPDP
jgi:hypothetical protein